MPSLPRITRRAALGLLGAGALGYAAWPRRPRRTTDVPSGRTLVTYWEKWTGPEAEALQTVVADVRGGDRDARNEGVSAADGGEVSFRSPPDELGAPSPPFDRAE